MSGLPNLPNTTIRDAVLSLSVEELDGFFSHIDADPELELNGLDAHWYFRSFLYARKKTKDVETPMYYLRGRYLSAQRISYILYYMVDPVKKSRIETLCSVTCCVNPLHLEYRK
jgi:hypothetical protein